MRIIGRNEMGQIVGYFERFSPASDGLTAQRCDAGLRLIEQIHACSFRASVAWLCAIGAVQFECIESKE